MHLPTLVKRSYVPKDNDPSHPPSVFGKKYEITLLGFVKLGLNEQEACDLSKEFLRVWETHASPLTTGNYVDTTPPLPVTLLAHNAIITEPITRESGY